MNVHRLPRSVSSSSLKGDDEKNLIFFYEWLIYTKIKLKINILNGL